MIFEWFTLLHIVEWLVCFIEASRFLLIIFKAWCGAGVYLFDFCFLCKYEVVWEWNFSA